MEPTCVGGGGERYPYVTTATDVYVATHMGRQRGDSNPCGQSPMDFDSFSLAARTQCHVMDGLPARQQGDAFDIPVAGDRGLRKRRSLLTRTTDYGS